MNIAQTVTQLIADWEEEADLIRPDHPEIARVLKSCADDLKRIVTKRMVTLGDSPK